MDIYKILQEYFGYNEFKPGQKEIIEAILAGRDGLAIMPTAGGKSLSYQLPSLLMPGISLVISPLISLMKDQVDSLDQIGISSCFINSSLSDQEFNRRMREIREGRYKLIYIAPERLNSYSFISLMNDLEISMLAVDEAHCISQWGHDFRPSYQNIPKFIDQLKTRPIVSAFTATATETVTQEIIQLLELEDPHISLVGFDRPNLFYSIVKPENKLNYIKSFIDENHKEESGIIYCSTRKSVVSLAKRLKALDYSVLPYHGGMSPESREENQNKFIMDQVDIIVATNAFGMGIDKPDVRYVIHYNMPQNMESYYQEAGRAGRDGLASDCVLMHSASDIVKQKFLIQNQSLNPQREFILYENLQYLIDYSNTNDCLRLKILEYFNEEPDFDKCNYCSNCLDDSELVDITIESQKILSCIYRAQERFGVNMIIDILRGSRNRRILENNLDELSTYGIMKNYSKEAIREMIMTLVSRDYIHMTAHRFPTLRLTSKSREVLNGQVEIYHKKDLLTSGKKVKSLSQDEVLAHIDYDLLDLLKELRSKLASERSVPPFMILHDSSLEEMASIMPYDKDGILRIKGIGDKKYESFGQDFLDLIKNYREKNNIKKGEGAEVRRESLEERYENTYKEYEKGLDLDEISQIRGFQKSTIINHLSRCQEAGLEVDWSRFISEAREKRVLAAIEEVGGIELLRDIKEVLPSNYSYDDINISIIKNKLRDES